MTDLINLVGTLGFPIAVAVYLLWERGKVREETRTDRNNTIEMVTEALNNNTKALTELTSTIDSKLS